MFDTNDRRYSRKEAADYLGVSVKTLADWAYTGKKKLPYYRPGKQVFYLESDLKKFLESCRKGV